MGTRTVADRRATRARGVMRGVVCVCDSALVSLTRGPEVCGEW